MQCYTAFQTKEILSHATKMDEPWGHHAKKSVKKGQMLWLKWGLWSNQIHRRNANSKKYKVQWWLSGSVRRAKRAAVNGYRV